MDKYFVHLKPVIKGYCEIDDNISTNDTLESEIKRRYKGIYELDYIHSETPEEYFEHKNTVYTGKF